MASRNLHPPVCGFGGDDLAEDARRALRDTIRGFYLEALDRLPITDYPNLVDCLSTAGHCYGLLDPVSNIILHAVAAHGRRRRRRDPYNHNTEDHAAAAADAGFLEKVRSNTWYWLPTAERCLDGLTAFLMSSYRYLTSDQAVRYLCLAKADAYVAMLLVQRDFDGRACCSVEEELVVPAFDGDAWLLTVKASMTYAALAAEHPNPELLVSLATDTFGAHHADKLAAWLRAGRIGTAAVDGMYDSLVHGTVPAPDGGHCLYSRLRASCPDAAAAAATDALCTDTASCVVHRCPSPLKRSARDASPCDYISRIEAQLVDHIHALHLAAVSRLSPASVALLHRGLVVAGYLYGPLENPVFNILLNAIWYQLNDSPAAAAAAAGSDSVPPPPAAAETMICTDLMLRNGFNALTAQVTFLCSKYGMASGHDALECLYSAKCHLSAAAQLAEAAGHRAVVSSSGSGDDVVLSAATEAAVKAMRHPRPASMMSLMDSLTPELEAKLCRLLPAKGQELSVEAIHHISCLLSSHVTVPMIKSPVAVVVVMHPRALEKIAQERRAFVEKQSFLMEMVSSLLDDENYKVHTICAVTIGDVRGQKLYHVNFLATRTDASGSGHDHHRRVLFFAQIFLGGRSRRTCGEERSVRHRPNNLERRSFCCPVTISAFLGRCFVCEVRRAKIIHPLCAGMEYFGRQETTYLDFRNSVARNPHGRVHNYKLESDYVYFDPNVNTELANHLNERAKEEEQMTEEEAYEFSLKTMPIGMI